LQQAQSKRRLAEQQVTCRQIMPTVAKGLTWYLVEVPKATATATATATTTTAAAPACSAVPN